MELVIRSTGDRTHTHIEVDGVEIPRVTMINFIGSVDNGVQCVFEQLSMDADGRPVVENGELKREIKRIDLARGEIV